MRRAPNFELAAAFRACDDAFNLSAKEIESTSQRLGFYIPFETHHKTHQSYRPSPRRFELYRRVYSAHLLNLDASRERQASERLLSQERKKTTALDRLIEIYYRPENKTPISEQLRLIDSVAKCRQFLRSYRRSRSNMRRFDAALANIGDIDSLQRLFAVLCQLHEESWDGGFEGFEIAPVVLSRLGALPFHQDKNYRRIVERLETAVTHSSPGSVYALEPLCMSAMEQKHPGAYVRHVTRLLNDYDWQCADNRTRELYYGTEDATIENVFRHVRDRPIELRSHDVGTVIGLAEESWLSIDERVYLQGAMEASLIEIGISRPLFEKFRDRVLLAAT